MTLFHEPAEINFLLTPPHDCGYLPRVRASTLFVDPRLSMDPRLYEQLLLTGFRRSGEYVYRPHCQGCQGCIPVRILVNDFVLSRSMRRVIRRNQDLTVAALPPLFKEEHFALYHRYIGMRHKGGAMDDPTREGYMDFLTSSWMDTVFFEFRREGRLVMVAVADVLSCGLSAVYTFFDPDEEAGSPGTYAILWEIEQTRRMGGVWHYLGYWIEACPKMQYKARFRPLQMFHDGRWRTMP